VKAAIALPGGDTGTIRAVLVLVLIWWITGVRPGVPACFGGMPGEPPG